MYWLATDSTKQRTFEIVQIKGGTQEKGDKEKKKSREAKGLKHIPRRASPSRATRILGPWLDGGVAAPSSKSPPFISLLSLNASTQAHVML